MVSPRVRNVYLRSRCNIAQFFEIEAYTRRRNKMNDDLPCSGWPEDSTKAEDRLRKDRPRSFLVHDSDRSDRNRLLHPEVPYRLTDGPKGVRVGRLVEVISPVDDS